MSVKDHRSALLNAMPDGSIAVLYSGRETLANEDEYLPFVVNSNFYYLTDQTRGGMVLLLCKYGGRETEQIFIERSDDFVERWTGKMPKAEEVQAKSQIENVQYTDSFAGAVNRAVSFFGVDKAFFDCYRCDPEDLPTYNAVKAEEFKKLYPAVSVMDIRSLMLPLREVKDEDEISRIRKAVEITKTGLDVLLKRLKPGMAEYQAQTVFEYTCFYEGAENMAFPTIAAGGLNACSMHYNTNRDILKDGELALFDLGAKYQNYCSDVTRTYPVSGRFTSRQKAVYNLVLKANKAVAAKAAPGVTLAELEKLTCSILGEGLVTLGLLDDAKDVRKYYMHSVSHSLGIDSHDASRRDVPLKAGWVISDEPGLYIDEEGFGVRIEDDLLITKNGCEVLTASIPKEISEIEAIMSAKEQ